MSRQPKRIRISDSAFVGRIDGVYVCVEYLDGWVTIRADRVRGKGHGRAVFPRQMRIRPTQLAEFLGAAIDGFYKRSAGAGWEEAMNPEYQFPLRPNVTVTIRNIPKNIKTDEVERIVEMLKALVVPSAVLAKRTRGAGACGRKRR